MNRRLHSPVKTRRGSAWRLQSLQFHLSYSLGTVIDTSKVQDRFPGASFGLVGVPV